MKCVILSDSHNQHRDVELPAGDILIHCGDFTMGGKEYEIAPKKADDYRNGLSTRDLIIL